MITTWGSTNPSLPVNKHFFLEGTVAPGVTDPARLRRGARPAGSSGVQSDLTGTVKFEQALVRKWSLVVFADVRGTATQLRKYPFDTLLYAAGGGVRYLTLIGPIRVEYGHNLNPRPDDPAGAWMLSIGFPF